MKANSVTYICFVQDHSGSMDGNKELAITNFNEQRAKLLKEDDETMDNIVTIVEFDDEIHCNIDNVPISDIKKMDKWWIGGMTALYDAIGYGIDLIEAKMEKDEREDKAAIVVVQTDGHENASSKYPSEEGRVAINKRINKLEDSKIWSFVFLGENIDKAIAMSMGFKTGNIMSHASGEENVRYAYNMTTDGLGDYMKSRKMGKTATMNFYAGGNSGDFEEEIKNDNSSK